MECKQEKNLKFCSCTYTACNKRGICCECIKYHKNMGEIPGCLFPPEAERVYDRSIEFFIKVWAEKFGYELIKK